MNRLAVISTTALLAACLGNVGCQDQYQKELKMISQERNELLAKNQRLQADLDAAGAENGRLAAELNDKKAQLDATRARMAELERTPPAQPPGPVSAKFTLASDILFSPGRASLSKQGTGKLRQIAATITSKHPNDLVRVYGFTDSDPIKKSAKYWKDNLDLSANRAMAVSRLLRELGIPAEKIETVAMGSTHFVASNSNRTGKAKNRRVEIEVVQAK